MADMSTVTYGRAGEVAAQKHLEHRGWRIIAENYRTNGGELDIVAYRLGVLAYVEVKTRSGDSYGAPADAVDECKRECIRAAARGFMREQSKGGRVPVYSKLLRSAKYRPVLRERFDIIEIMMTRSLKLESLRHIKNAFV